MIYQLGRKRVEMDKRKAGGSVGVDGKEGRKQEQREAGKMKRGT